MATTTPNYGWSVPESTDLVKDGATAIELLGDSIDASFVDLLGGTTGQVLTKASGTDLDFSFTTPSAAGGKVLQVVQATHATQVDVATSTFTDTGLTVNITPSSATSKVMIIATHSGTGKDTNDTGANMRLMRDATSVGTFVGIHGLTSSAATNIANCTLTFLDSPATTSAITYKTQLMSGANVTKVFTGAGGATSVIIAMEIGA